MKIAVWHNLPSGGGKRGLYSHVKGLLEHGHHVEAWCPPTADREYLPLGELIREHVVELDWTRGTDRGALASLNKMRRRLRAMKEHCERCGKEIAAGGFDILFANSCAFFATSPIARYAGLASVLYLQEPYRVLYEALPDLPWWAPAANGRSLRHWKRVLGDAIRVQGLRLQAREEALNAARFDQILVNSLFSRESVARAYGIDSQVCYLGIDEKIFYPTGEAKENFVVGLGSITYGKGPERAVHAIGAIPSESRPRLVWVGNFGEASYVKAVQELARKCGVDLATHVRIADEEIRSILSRATLLLYTPRLEPFGYAPLEANACGTPVVAIAEGGIRETVEDGVNGLLVKDADAEALAAAMRRLLDDKELAKRLGQAGIELVRKKWNLSGANERLESALSQVAKS